MWIYKFSVNLHIQNSIFKPFILPVYQLPVKWKRLKLICLKLSHFLADFKGTGFKGLDVLHAANSIMFLSTTSKHEHPKVNWLNRSYDEKIKIQQLAPHPVEFNAEGLICVNMVYEDKLFAGFLK